MTSAEANWRDAAAELRRDAARALANAARCELMADLLALDGVTLLLDEATAPCALTPGALFGEAP